MKYKIDFKNKDAQNYYIVKLLDNKEIIMRNGNTERFVDCVVDKWVLINRDTDRIENDMNPHIEDLLESKQINNWRLDGWRYCNVTHHRLSDVANCAMFEINFDTGEFKRVIAKGEARCPNCGKYIKRKLIYGKYCRDCLTCSGGLAYRYCYHDYYDGYDLPEKYDVDKQPLFGCEIERDYSAQNNNGSFDNNLKESMLDIVKIFHQKELKSGNLKRQNVFMRDSSLYNDGLEWITFPHTFNWYNKNRDKFEEALDKIKNRGFCATSSAGNHIHINRAFFGDDAEFCAAKMSILFNTYWDEYVAISGRYGQSTRYCNKPSQNKGDSIFNVVRKTLSNASDHCVAVNLQHSATIEVRLWSAIKNVDDLLFYLDNMQALARYVKRASLEKVQVAKFTDFMKYYQLESSLTMAKTKLNEAHITKYDEIIDKMRGE